MKIIFTLCLSVLFFSQTFAQKTTRAQQIKTYIEAHKALAMQEQLRSGVPAAVTLAQGILETSAGTSELMTKANNHFGIKCKKAWTGETFAHTDDAPNECFRKYNCALDSYKDHSDYLKSGTRYAVLFTMDAKDYSSWAKGLKRCGYATSPTYAQQLIKIIEDNNLQQYTFAALDYQANGAKLAGEIIPVPENPQPVAFAQNSTEVTTSYEAAPQPYGPTDGVVIVNGLKAIYAHKGDLLLPIAIKYNIRYATLLEWNDLPEGPLPADMPVYLEKKNVIGYNSTHIVKAGETVLMVAQFEGMQISKIRSLNMLDVNEEVAPGQTILLQRGAMVKPQTIFIVAKQQINTVQNPLNKTRGDDYVPTNKTGDRSSKEVETTASAEKPSAPEPIVNGPATPVKPNTVSTIPAPATAIIETPQTTPIVSNVVTSVPTKDSIILTPKEEAVPQDEFSRLKARLDKVVYQTPTPASSSSSSSSSKIIITNTNAPNTTPEFYTVKEGDTAFSITKKFGITMHDLMALNKLNFEELKPGRKLRVK